jgi:uncharacterized protein (UPF0332 family)
MNERGEALVRYRLEQADESLESAQLLSDNGKCRPSVSRSYYAMFYSVLALLIKKGLRISKHTGAISAFNREFVKKGIFDKELSSWLQQAFDLRQRADYRELFMVSPERAEKVLKQARTFVNEVKNEIAKNRNER